MDLQEISCRSCGVLGSSAVSMARRTKGVFTLYLDLVFDYLLCFLNYFRGLHRSAIGSGHLNH